MEKDTVLYKHIRKSDGIIFYIGIGNDKRAYSKKGRNNHWRNVVKKYDYIVEIIADNLTWDEACDLEKRLIFFYGRKDLGLGELVNQTDGGDGAKNPSPENRKKMSDRRKGEKNPMFGRTGNKSPMFGKTGDKHPMFGRTGEKNPTFGTKRPQMSIKMKGEKSSFFGKTGDKHPRFGKPSKIRGDKHPMFGKTGDKHPTFGKTGDKHAQSKKVICDRTNKIYGCAREAAEDNDMNYSTLRNWLNGRRKNKSSLRYYEE